VRLEKRPVAVNAPARRIKVKTGCGAMWIMLVFDDDGKVVEIFTINGHSGGCRSNTVAVSRLVSCLLRYGAPLDEIIHQLSQVDHCRSYDRLRREHPEVTATSCPAAIAEVLREYVGEDPLIAGAISNVVDEIAIGTVNADEYRMAKQEHPVSDNPFNCPDCGAPLRFMEGCQTCVSCGWSKCS
jgi:ribonucleoside-diphosphate reductase alpha chain